MYVYCKLPCIVLRLIIITVWQRVLDKSSKFKVQRSWMTYFREIVSEWEYTPCVETTNHMWNSMHNYYDKLYDSSTYCDCHSRGRPQPSHTSLEFVQDVRCASCMCACRIQRQNDYTWQCGFTRYRKFCMCTKMLNSLTCIEVSAADEDQTRQRSQDAWWRNSMRASANPKYWGGIHESLRDGSFRVGRAAAVTYWGLGISGL
jgi:hypothetical protein